ncbi:hypothetical protein [Nocardia stercoris]|uniref:SRPBCC family protein n=1 Tax=Nocardia stercoris TaxID=2483361 RepID=A0A3M2L8I6_9NOCA|nr:hypothetical protein [Nocardia stercoris]RMI33000.1 hypothetical protein EBN03_12325 [Nocardia stercoris]
MSGETKRLATCVVATGIVLGGMGFARADPSSIAGGTGIDAEWDASWAAYEAEEDAAGPELVSVTVDLPITIGAPLDRVFPAYSDVYNGFGRHPFLHGVLPRRHYLEDGAEVSEFIALEDIPAGPALIPGRTVAQQRVHADGHWYTSDTWDAPGVITHQTVTFAEQDGVTDVVEHLTFVAPAALIDYTVQNGVSSHLAYQSALARDLEDGTL